MKQPGRRSFISFVLLVCSLLFIPTFSRHACTSRTRALFRSKWNAGHRKQRDVAPPKASVPHTSTLLSGKCWSVAFITDYPGLKCTSSKSLRNAPVLGRPLGFISKHRENTFLCGLTANSNICANAEDYPFEPIEAKWTTYFAERCSEYSPALIRNESECESAECYQRDKMYILSMIPYPSGSGLHIGHCYTYTLADVVARFYRLKLREQLYSQGKRMKGIESLCQKSDSEVPEEGVISGKGIPVGVDYKNVNDISSKGEQGLRPIERDHSTFEEFPLQPNVLHVMGWDSFGLPAEQHSRQRGEPPEKVVRENIARFKWQLQRLGISVDWRREIATSDPRFFRWTQWAFLEMFKRGLAYEKEAVVNWCQSLGTVLANEEVTADGLSERGSFPVVRRPMRQWHLRLRTYAKRLLEGLDLLEWPEDVLKMQREWIGFREYAVIPFGLLNSPSCLTDAALKCTLMFPEEILEARAVVVHPCNSLATKIYANPEYKRSVDAYVAASVHNTTQSGVDFTSWSCKQSAGFTNNHTGVGVFTGVYVRHPISGAELPVIVSSIIEDTAEFGHQIDSTDIILITPALKSALSSLESHGLLHETHTHDAEDFALYDSMRKLQALPVDEARKRALTILTERHLGAREVRFHLRDWLFSRQRYWGEPIPVLRGCPIKMDDTLFGTSEAPHRRWSSEFLTEAVIFPLSEKSLPLSLPPFRPEAATGTERYTSGAISLQGTKSNIIDRSQPTAALSLYPEWLTSAIPGDVAHEGLRNAADAPARLDPSLYNLYREACTMPQWAGSSWYHLRFVDPFNNKFLANPEALRFWMPVDLYIGGKEHAVTHLIYARFWHKVLADIGIPCGEEPFKRLVVPGVILGKPVHLLLKRIDTGEPVSADSVRLIKEPTAVVTDANRQNSNCSYSETSEYKGIGSNQSSFLLKHDPCGTHVKSGASVYAEVVPSRFLRTSHSSDGGWYFQTPNNDTVKVLTVSEKMSKSKGNTVAPDELLETHGADALRLHLMTLGPVGATKTWTVDGLQGAKRFLRRLWSLCSHYTLPHTPSGFKCSSNGRLSALSAEQSEICKSALQEDRSGNSEKAASGKANDVRCSLSADERKVLGPVIRSVTRKLEHLQLNTAVSKLYECLKQLQCLEKTQGFLSVPAIQTFLLLLHPFAPFITEELWGRISRIYSSTVRHPLHSLTASGVWPIFPLACKQQPTDGFEGARCETYSSDDLRQLDHNHVTVSVMFDGRRRLKLEVPEADLASAEAFRRAVEKHPVVKARLHEELEHGKLVSSVISLPRHKIVNFVFKGNARNDAPSLPGVV